MWQTAGVALVNVTGRCDDAVACSVTGECASVVSRSAANVIDWLVRPTPKLRCTGGAGSNRASPAWSPSTVHVPAATNEIVAPFVPPAVQTAGVIAVIVTTRPDDAVALIVTGGPSGTFGVAPKVTVCWALVTVRLCRTGGAALKAMLPAWSAWTVHVPGASTVIVAPRVPPDEHTVGRRRRRERDRKLRRRGRAHRERCLEHGAITHRRECDRLVRLGDEEALRDR